METTEQLRQEIKQMMVENLMLQVTADEIGDEQPLFGPESLGLDSVDALQLVVALDKKFQLKISDPDTARQVLRSVNSMAEAVVQHQAGGSNGQSVSLAADAPPKVESPK
ncbi:MAG: phosphopantetheine-binding protein [Verrucomicrobiota bacterium]